MLGGLVIGQVEGGLAGNAAAGVEATVPAGMFGAAQAESSMTGMTIQNQRSLLSMADFFPGNKLLTAYGPS